MNVLISYMVFVIDIQKLPVALHVKGLDVFFFNSAVRVQLSHAL